MRLRVIISSLAVAAVLSENGGESLRAVAARRDDVKPAAAALDEAGSLRPDQVSDSGPVSRYSCEVVNVFPHDRGAFTQGLVFLGGGFFESTGLNGQSSLREVELKTGRVLRRKDVPAQYFAEGLAVLDGKAFQLTWRAGKAFVYDLKSFEREKEFSYEGEGWGLTTDGRRLIMSNGTSEIRFL